MRVHIRPADCQQVYKSYENINNKKCTLSTQGCHFEWPTVTLSDLAKYLVTRSNARSLCDSWASYDDRCIIMRALQQLIATVAATIAPCVCDHRVACTTTTSVQRTSVVTASATSATYGWTAWWWVVDASSIMFDRPCNTGVPDQHMLDVYVCSVDSNNVLCITFRPYLTYPKHLTL